MEYFRRVIIGLLLCSIISHFPTTCLSVAAPKSSDEKNDTDIKLITSFSRKLLETLNEDHDKESAPSLHERLLGQLSSFTQNVFKDASKAVSSTDVHHKSSKRLLNSSEGDGKDMTQDNLSTSNITENAAVTVPPSKYSLKPDEENVANDTTALLAASKETEKNTSSSNNTTVSTVEKEESQQNVSSSRNITETQEGSGKPEGNTSFSLQLEEKESNLSDVGELKKMKRVGQLLIPVFARIRRRAAALRPIPEKFDSQVTIGRSKVPGRWVTPVGDIDSNGHIDYIVSTPHSSNYTGKIRLHLMKAKNQFLYSRELVPGKHGFTSPPLSKGDRYGSAVTHIPANATFIAVSAPGDHAVYVLKLNRKGDVEKSVKAQAKPKLKENMEDDPNGKAEYVYEDLDSAMVDEQLKVLGDVTSVVFEAADGEVLAKVQVDAKRDKPLLSKVEREYMLSESLEISSMPVRNATSNDIVLNRLIRLSTQGLTDQDIEDDRSRNIFLSKCLFNQTHCACGAKRANSSSMQDKLTWLEVDGKDHVSGRDICLIRRGKIHNKNKQMECRCDGDALCSRMTKTVMRNTIERGSTFINADEASRHVFCQKEQFDHVIVKPIHVPKTEKDVSTFRGLIDETKPIELTELNSTHCLCSPTEFKDLPHQQSMQQCLRYKLSQTRRAIFCKSGPCVDSDKLGLPYAYTCRADGVAFCQRDFVRHEKWVVDGSTDEKDTVFCHREKTRYERAHFLFHLWP